MRYAAYCLLMFLLSAGAAAAQDGAVATLTTDKEVYAYGESIELRYKVENQGDEEFVWWGSSSCIVGFAWEQFVHPGESYGCTLDYRPFFFPPGSSRTFIWELIPGHHAAPEVDGVQEIMAGQGIVFDPATVETAQQVASVSFEAPLFLGGRIYVRLADGFVLEDVADVMVVLEVQIVEDWSAIGAYVWQIHGMTVPDAVQQYADDERFETIAIWRHIDYATFTSSVEPGGELTEAGLSAPFPNPATTTVRLELLPPADGPVRVELLDLQGRRVALLHDDPLPGGQVVTITLDAPRLAAGTYLVRAAGAGYAYSRPLTIVR